MTSRAQSTSLAPIAVAVTHGIDGAVAGFDCASGGSPPVLGDRSARIHGARSDGYFAIDSGALLGFTAPTQLAIEWNRAAFAQLIAASGWHALALARRDLAAPRNTLARATEALEQAGVPIVLSNLRCSASARELCEHVVDATDSPRIFTVGTSRPALVSAIHPSALRHIARDRAEGIELESPLDAIVRATAQARAAGATHVIAVYDPRRDDPVADSLDLARQIPVESAPDVLLVNDVAPQLRRALSGPHARMLLIATPDNGFHRFEVADDRVTVTHGSHAVPVAEYPAFAQPFAASVCARDGVALLGARLEAPLDARGLVAMVADVLRHYARADVSIVNYGLVDRRHYRPLRGQIRRLDMLLALPLDNALRRTRVTGAVLKKAFTATARGRFLFRGMRADDDGVTVNGRPIEEESLYTVSATDFVVAMNVLPEDTEWSEFATRSTREALLAYLDLARDYDPRRTADDPSRLTRWLFSLSVTGTLTNVNLTNPATAILTDAQLSRSEALSAQLSIDARANANHPNFTWENTVTARYGLARTITASTMTMPAGGAQIAETADLLSLRSVFAFRGLQTSYPRWYVPAPYVEMYAESELTRPDSREYHHLELRPTGGARFAVADRFSVFFGVGASAEVLADRAQLPSGQSPLVPTIQLGWVLQPGKFFSIGDREIQWNSTLDLAIRDVFRFAGIQLRAHAGVQVPLVGPLSLTLAYDLFLRYLQLPDVGDGMVDALGYAGDLEVGLGVNLSRGVQTFGR